MEFFVLYIAQTRDKNEHSADMPDNKIKYTIWGEKALHGQDISALSRMGRILPRDAACKLGDLKLH